MIQGEIIRQITMIQEEKDVKSGPQKLGEGALVLFVCEINFAQPCFLDQIFIPKSGPKNFVVG